MAIFVEGKTERLFVERLLTEIAGANVLSIEVYVARGGGRSGARALTQIKVSDSTTGCAHFVLIVDCGADNRVRSDVGEQYDSLVEAGYSTIVGIRDVFPDFSFSEVARLRGGLAFRLRTTPIRVQFVLGVMEIESWFLAEHSHFPRLHASITVERIVTRLNFNAAIDDLQLRPNPATDLHNVYNLEGFAYQKNRNQIQRTINLLDYATLYVQTKNRFPDLDQFVATIDEFLH